MSTTGQDLERGIHDIPLQEVHTLSKVPTPIPMEKDEPGKDKETIGRWMARHLLKPFGLWVHTRNLKAPYALVNGFPRVTDFIMSDPDHLVSVFKRFDALTVRNLLRLEARVAALEALQQRLDDEDRENLSKNPVDFALTVMNMSYEYAAVLSQVGVSLPTQDEVEQKIKAGNPSVEEAKALKKKAAEAIPETPAGGIPRYAHLAWKADMEEEELTWVEKQKPNRLGPGVGDKSYKKGKPDYFRTRWIIANEIEKALKEYQEAVILQDKMLKLQHPTKGTVKVLQTFIKGQDDEDPNSRPPQFTGFSAARDLLGNKNKKGRFSQAEDLISLHPPGDDDFGTTIMKTIYGNLLRRRGTDDPEFNDVSEKAVQGVTTIWTFFTAMGFLMGSVWLLWRIGLEEVDSGTKFERKLAIVTGFTALFGMWVAVFTSIRRSEIFGATAAYAAVLIVFIGAAPGNT